MNYELETDFLNKIVNEWSENSKAKFFNFINNSDQGKQRLVIRLSTISVRENKTDCFIFIFPHLMENVANIIVAVGYWKTDFHFHASVNENDRILSVLIENKFVPKDHEFRHQVIHCDETILSLFQNCLMDDSEIRVLIKKVVDISLNLFHRSRNRQFLEKLFNISVVKSNFNFHNRIVQYSYSDKKEVIDIVKFFIIVGHTEKLGQFFIDQAINSGLRWPTQNIDNLIFLIEHGGTKIDRVLSVLDSEKDKLFDVFFQLTVRKIKFETQDEKLLTKVKQFLASIKIQLEQVVIIKEVVDIIMSF
jgi:hypothetical protein